MKLVILESPYAGVGRFWFTKLWTRWMNVRYARACVRDSLGYAESPLASHLYLTTILDDTDSLEREIGIDAGLAWRVVSEGTVVYTDRGISRGMEYGIAAAKASGKTVEYRTLPGYTSKPAP